MGDCADIRRTIEVGVPAEAADADWTTFVFDLQFNRRPGADASESQADESFVRLESIEGERTRVTVDLNYCSQYEDIKDEQEIAEVQKSLDWMLDRYKTFVERQRAA